MQTSPRVYHAIRTRQRGPRGVGGSLMCCLQHRVGLGSFGQWWLGEGEGLWPKLRMPAPPFP